MITPKATPILTISPAPQSRKWQYVHGAPVCVIALDPYEWSNLLAALEAAQWESSPLMALNTGDWLGQISQKLPQRAETEAEAAYYAWRQPPPPPNSTAENMRQRAKDLAPPAQERTE